jgi:AraC-like DNA-binding protein
MDERLFLRLPDDATCGPESNTPAGALLAGWVDPRLRGYVDNLLYCREQFDPGDEVVERVLPDGNLRLAFNLGDPPTAGSGPGVRVEAIGATAAPALVRLGGTVEGVTVTVRAGAALALLGVPAGELEERAVDLTDLWGRAAPKLLERLAGAPDDAARYTLLNEALLQRFEGARDHGRAKAARAAQLMATSATLTVREAASAVGVGERRLQQLFHLHVGVSPRTWRRLKRFESCLRLLRQRPGLRWSELAVVTGYYDQPHLVSEFAAFSGLTPGAFRDRAVSGSSKTAP